MVPEGKKLPPTITSPPNNRWTGERNSRLFWNTDLNVVGKTRQQKGPREPELPHSISGAELQVTHRKEEPGKPITNLKPHNFQGGG